jgi:outer membrane protein TolC
MRRLVIALSCALVSLAAAAQTAGPLDFASARALSRERSDKIRIESAETEHRAQQLESDRSLHGPKVEIDVKQVWGRKKLDLGEKSLPLPGMLPRLLHVDSISIPLTFEQNLDGPRALLSAEMPIYTGGAISAKISADEASVFESRANEQAQADAVDSELAKKYFGVQLTRSVESLREQMLDQQQKELEKAQRFEKKGLISKLERLTIEVNRDKARRELAGARTDRQVAESELARMLREPSVGSLATPLFIVPGDLGTLSGWQKKALSFNPTLASIDAKRNMAEQGVTAAQAAWKPQVYAFARKNLIRHYLSITEPDWLAGVGVRFTLWDNHDRNASIASARALVHKAQAARSEAENQIAVGIETAYLKSVQSRDEYQLTLSTLDLARENLRMREKAFSEGLSTANDLDDARTRLIGAEIARRVAAYKFVLAWASLHAVAGRMDEFVISASDSSNILEK